MFAASPISREAIGTTPDDPLVMLVPEMPGDELNRKRAERMIRAAGSLALDGTFGEPGTPEESLSAYPTLMHAIQAASDGDTMARQVVYTNALTDFTERGIKAGHVTQTKLGVDGRGRILQYGQLLQDVHLNALRYTTRSPAMRARTEAETRNGVRIDSLRRHGLLEDYAFVVFSCYPDDMSDEAAAAAGFFHDTKSLAIQVFSGVNDHMVQRSAFVAGVAEPDGCRHDIAAVQAVAKWFGVSLAGKTTTQMIDTPLLIHKSLIPNGVIDLVALYDEMAGGTFFGQARPAQDYLAYLEVCQEREAGFESAVQMIVDQLIKEVASIRTPLDAVKRLHEISQARLVHHAFGDKSIDPRVFGEVAAGYVEEARVSLAQGDIDRFLSARAHALATARSYSCPAEFGREKEGEGQSVNRGSSDNECEFESKECPICKTPNVWTKVTRTRITGSCGCWVVKKAA